MDASAEHPRSREDESNTPERTAASRPRGESGNAAAAPSARPAHDTRRKRPAEDRYAGWGDGINRAFCARAERFVPSTFPVASHAGAATIVTAVVARRPEALLFCSFSHCGAHVWPDGEIVAEPTGENP